MLFGWYLMFPPVGSGRIEVDAPLSRWQVAEPFDTAAECEKRRGYEMEHNKHDLPIVWAQCIATDDPRLAK